MQRKRGGIEHSLFGNSEDVVNQSLHRSGSADTRNNIKMETNRFQTERERDEREGSKATATVLDVEGDSGIFELCRETPRCR